MRILALSPHLPWPLYGGNVVRIYGILRELAGRGHEIVLLAGYEGPPLADDHPVKILCREVRFYRPPASARQTRPVLAALASVLSPLPYTAAKFGGRTIQESIREVLEANHFDLILANFAFMAHLIPADLARNTPVVLDEHESEGLLWRQYLRQGGIAKRAFALLNLVKMGWFQKAVSSRIVAMLSASEREASFARTFLPRHVKLWIVPNGVDTVFFTPAAQESEGDHSLVLCAGFGVYRNCEAAIWFVRQILPRVREAIPDAQFWIVGSNPPPEVRQLGEFPGVHVTGTVEDVRPYYARAAVSVAPYRYGEGTKLKVLEAMASGVPVVSTTIGCQGIEVRDGEHLLVADTPDAFTARVVGLLRSVTRRRGIGTRARFLVEQQYAWTKIVGGLEPKLLKLAHEH
ncbi:MAG: glycosyltransferase [Terriglobia bacterium]|jgi:glycosyltransferase involved in cell wall biosynthesis